MYNSPICARHSRRGSCRCYREKEQEVLNPEQRGLRDFVLLGMRTIIRSSTEDTFASVVCHREREGKVHFGQVAVVDDMTETRSVAEDVNARRREREGGQMGDIVY